MTVRSTPGSPSLRREAERIVADLLDRRSGYVPRWQASGDDPGMALLRVEAAMLASLWERLDGVPDKNKLVFLSELGIDSLPPAAARAPVLFEPLPLAGNSVVPAGSLVGAEGDGGAQITFRTEEGIGVSASRLAEVHTVLPGRDTTGDHTIDISGERPVELFADQRPTERYLYIGHQELLAVRGQATISIEFVLGRQAQIPLTTVWSVWDGSVWREYRSGDVDDLTDNGTPEQPGAFGQSGTVALRSYCVESKPTEVDGVEAHWVRVELATPLALVNELSLPEIDQIRLAVERGNPNDPVVYPLTSALALGQPADLTSPFYPFGQAPDRTSIFYFDVAEALATRVDRLALVGSIESKAVDQEDDGDIDDLTGGGTEEEPTDDTPPPPDPRLRFEYWHGSAWDDLTSGSLGSDGVFAVAFEAKPNWMPSEVDGQPGTWGRVRLDAGQGYAQRIPIEVPVVDSDPVTIEVELQRPPLFADLRLEVSGRSVVSNPERVVSFDGASHNDHSEVARWRGSPFAPFLARQDQTPTLYLGFDGPLPAANLGLLFEIEPGAGDDAPVEHEFRWERFDGSRWVSLPVEDETNHLTATGIVRLLWPGNRKLRKVDAVAASDDLITTQGRDQANTFVVGDRVHLREAELGELATIVEVTGPQLRVAKPLEESYQNATMSEPEPALFGMPRSWIRARLGQGSAQPSITIDRLLANVTWASEQRRVTNEMLGSGNGQPNQRLFSTNTPLLPGVIVEVRELSGARARTDLPILERELAGTANTITVQTNADGDVDAAWVRWEVRTNLASSRADDRHCTIDLVTGVIRFGDDRNGRSLPTGAQNVRLSGDAGGGANGNVEVGAIVNPLSGMVVASLSNPVAATGGADAETGRRAADRAAHVVRHRYQAISADDYRSVALEASPEVFDAVVVAIDDDLGSRLRVAVLPASMAVVPEPSAQLLARVDHQLRRRCPAGAAADLSVVGPDFVEIGVEVTLAARPGQAETTFDAVRAALADFLHPVIGGPGSGDAIEPLSAGWCFGATVHTARFAPLLEAVDGVDYVESFSVTRAGAVVGDELQLAPDQVPLAGPISVRLVRAEAR